MNEHRIQLRRAWEGQHGETSSRVDLPTIWNMGEVPLRLSRSFHRPRSTDDFESFWLSMSAVEGLREVWLNGVILESHFDGQVGMIPLGELRESNRLSLVLRSDQIPTGTEWGNFALVIRSHHAVGGKDLGTPL